MATTPDDAGLLGPDTLRRLWKPRRDAYAQAHLYGEVRVRVHRAFTWLASAENRGPAEADTRLMELWSAAGALFATWDAVAGVPVPIEESIPAFSSRLCAHDHDGMMAAACRSIGTHLCAMADDAYLGRLANARARSSGGTSAEPLLRADGAQMREWIDEPSAECAVAAAMLRVGLTVEQLAWGAATYGGRQNRHAVKRCGIVMRALVPAAIQVITEHGYTDDWGPLCSPPRES
jgi:hypothetical protein